MTDKKNEVIIRMYYTKNDIRNIFRFNGKTEGARKQYFYNGQLRSICNF